jgi:hypothetical protein
VQVKQLAAELGEARRPTAAKAHPEASAKISLKSTPETSADWLALVRKLP